MKERVKYIDVARGMSILLIAVFHSNLPKYIPEIIEPMMLIRMPFMFFLSGIFLSLNLNTKYFILNKFESLLKPYFCIMLSLLFISFFFGDHTVDKQIIDLLYGNHLRWTPLWFITHLFAVSVFSYFFIRIINKIQREQLIFLILFCLILTGSFLVEFNLKIQFSDTIVLKGLPYSLDIVLLTAPFFMLGRKLRDYVITFKPSVYILALAIATFFVVSQFTNAKIDFYNRIYEMPAYATLAALSGIYIFLSVAYILGKCNYVNQTLMLFGKASLFVFLFHDFISWKCFNYLSSIFLEQYQLIITLISFFLSITIPLFIRYIVKNNGLLSLAFLPIKNTN